ncbi:hypothetical protein L6452_35340 [Arctium lappa]|uniref:Uncharacterized protein n=1 Tax=Arctium lappa TaxID=4217 RepID=A0ACB8Y6P8_ARCLA|nr:hypothetical protein L6452_35340 [Arctium lappa]
MQSKKPKQVLRARLARERQVNGTRKGVELRVAVSELERPWEVAETAPKLLALESMSNEGVFDMSLQDDGSYRILKKEMNVKKMILLR